MSPCFKRRLINHVTSRISNFNVKVALNFCNSYHLGALAVLYSVLFRHAWMKHASLTLFWFFQVQRSLQSQGALFRFVCQPYTDNFVFKKGRALNRMKRLIFSILLLLIAEVSLGAVAVTRGGGECFNVVSDLKRNWIEVKRHLLPGTVNIRVPKKEGFVCVSSGHSRNAMETRTSVSSSLRCFSNSMSKGMGFCCDESLLVCAQLNPFIFPEPLKGPGIDRVYKRPASLRVKPPGDDEQWKSN